MSALNRAFHWEQSAAIAVAIFSLVGCAAWDAPERDLIFSQPSGALLRTKLSDKDLKRLGAPVIYRFKTLPHVVYTAAVPSGDEFEMIRDPQARLTQGDDPLVDYDAVPVGQTNHRHGTDPRSQVKRPTHGPHHPEAPGRSESHLPSDEMDNNAGFEALFEVLRQSRQELAPVQVALIDSGVVAATPGIQKILKRVTNLTRDNEPRGWQSHATAIASIFGGVASEGPSRFAPRRAVETTADTPFAYGPHIHLHSIKISFSGDAPEAMDKNLGSLQLAVALDEAVASGAKLVNLSFSYRDALSPEVSAVERMVLSAAADKGVVFVAAAGNDNQSIDDRVVLPARYDLANIVVVGSHTQSGLKSSMSNFGERVDLTARGANLKLNNKWGTTGTFSGTSFAVPMVVAAMALYLGVSDLEKQPPYAQMERMLIDLFETATPQESEASSTGIVSRFGKLDAKSFVMRAWQRSRPTSHGVARPGDEAQASKM